MSFSPGRAWGSFFLSHISNLNSSCTFLPPGSRVEKPCRALFTTTIKAESKHAQVEGCVCPGVCTRVSVCT